MKTTSVAFTDNEPEGLYYVPGSAL